MKDDIHSMRFSIQYTAQRTALRNSCSRSEEHVATAPPSSTMKITDEARAGGDDHVVYVYLVSLLAEAACAYERSKDEEVENLHRIHALV